MGDAGIPIPIPEEQLPISQPSPDLSGTQPREIHILVTGFGPFKSFTNNPSYLIASALPHTLSPAPAPPPPSKDNIQPQPVRGYLPSFLHRHLSSNAQARGHVPPTPQPIRTPNNKPYIIHIHTYPDPIHVAYASTSVLIPSLLDPATNRSIFPDFPTGIDFDYILHIGLASGRDSYTLETLAHRNDYLIPDVDDSVGIEVSKIWKREGIPNSLEVGWDGADVLRRWKAEVERREAESLLNLDGISAPVPLPVPVPAPSPDTNSAPVSETKSEPNASDAPAKAWMLQHGLLWHSSSTTSTSPPNAESNPTPRPNPNPNLPAYTPIGGGTTLYQSTTTSTDTSTSTSTNPTPRPPRKSVVKLSRDAGRFLCEFILMCSLVHRYKQHRSQSHSESQSQTTSSTDSPSSSSKLGKVAFLHVPNGTEPADVARGAMVAESAIRSVIGSWEAGWRNGAVYDFDREHVVGAGVEGVGAGVGVAEGGFEDKGTGDEIPR